MAKEVTFEVDAASGTLIQDGAMFVGETVSVVLSGYEGTNPVLVLFQRRAGSLVPVQMTVPDDDSGELVLDLNNQQARNCYTWNDKQRPKARVALDAYIVDGESLAVETIDDVSRIVATGNRWIVASGQAQMEWAPLNFEADGTMVSLEGKPGTPGGKGDPGADGLDAYQVAVRNGYDGTEEQWYATIASAAPSATSAANAKAGAEAAQTGAESANESAQAAKRIAESYAAQAGEEKAGAQQAKNEAQSLKSLAESAREGADAAKTAAQTAQAAAEEVAAKINEPDRSLSMDGRAADAAATGEAIAGLFKSVDYDSAERKIVFTTHNGTKVKLAANNFIKDGMVSSVAIEGDYLVINFNTDAGTDPISIPLSQIFDPDNYYDKTAINALLAGKLDSVAVAPAFSTSSTYAVDDRCTYNGRLYRCKIAVTVAGEWELMNWTEVTVQDVLAAIWTALGEIPSWAKAASKPTYTLNEVCPDVENWLGVPGTTAAGKSIKVLAKTVNGVIEGGLTVTGSSNNDNNTTKYRYGGVTVTRNGVATDYLFDGSQSGIARLSNVRYDMPTAVALVAEDDAATLVCADRAVTNATIAAGFSTLNLTFPEAVSGKVRDFYLRIVVAAGESAPALSIPQGITIENPDGAVPEIADGETSAASTTLVWFSETAPNIFTAKSETVKAVA